MKNFFLRNPGLRSRVPFTVKFNDYTAKELVDICELEANKRGFGIDADAKNKLKKLCEKVVGNADMGNGRFCRNLVEKAILNFATRIYVGNGINKVKEYILEADDFKELDINKKPEPIGFKAV